MTERVGREAGHPTSLPTASDPFGFGFMRDFIHFYKFPPPPEVVVDERLGLEIDDEFEVSGQRFRVVGKTASRAFVLDEPLIFMDMGLAQGTFLADTPFVNTALIKVADGYDRVQLANHIMERTPFPVDVHTADQLVDIYYGRSR